MLPEEARHIADIVRKLDLGPGDSCLNIGSSTRRFREVEQPHNHRDLIAPLEEFGLRIIHCDLKPDDGVDIAGDVFDPVVRARMAQQQARLLLCCNILEHLVDPQPFACACADLVRPGGYVVVSVPLSFPYHRDPIDTMLRPSPEQIADFFPGWETVHSAVVKSQTFQQELLAQPKGVMRLVRHGLQVLLPFYRPQKWMERAHRILWLWRPYKVSVAVLRRPYGTG